jgi:T5SS/PEP-CTERM-associated repeat protein
MRQYLFVQIKSSQLRRNGMAWRPSRFGLLRAAAIVAIVANAILSRIDSARANVQSSGNIFPIDNPFDVDGLGQPVDTGLPALGNFLNVSSPPLPAEMTAAGQPNFEGVFNTAGNQVQTNVLVGPKNFGQLLITGNTQLRDETLIIGGALSSDTAAGFTPPQNTTFHGTGFVRITDPGSLYNNDPTILPFGLDPATFGSARPKNGQFDLYVGRSGTGTLQIDTGGSAEIQDSIVVGDQSGSTGTLIVDGSDSFLGNTGQFPQGADPSDPGMMVIGRRGSGHMTVTNGAQVVANGPTAVNGTTTIAACVGSDPTTASFSQTQAGGQGSVTIDGFGSKWAVQGGGLQIGGFDSTGISTDPATADLPGSDPAKTNYVPNTGRGTLNVNNGAIVTVNANSAANAPPPSLDMLIGQYGTVNMGGGSIEVNDQLDSSAINAQRTIFFVRTINDGIISGTGSITTGQFTNRSLGRVQVGAGQKLVVTSTGRFNTSSKITELPLSNWGLIEVLGTETSRAEIDFQRNTPSLPDTPPSQDQPSQFFNFRQATAPANGGRQVGTIIGQSATIRFGTGTSVGAGIPDSGIENNGVLSLTGGTNVVSGAVDNEPVGLVSVVGNATSATFEDDFLNEGTFQIGPSNVNVSVLGNYSGNIPIFGSGAGAGSGSDYFSHLAVGGNLSLTGTVALNPASPADLVQGQRFDVISFGGTFSGLVADQVILGSNLILRAVPDQPRHVVEIWVCDTNNMCGAAGSPGGGFLPPPGDADLDGNGIVNAADLAIWMMNFGKAGVGDVNGDGIVDAADYVIIRAHLGLPMGAGAGAGLGAAVPEPASAVLLLSGGLLALAIGQRRKER